MAFYHFSNLQKERSVLTPPRSLAKDHIFGEKSYASFPNQTPDRVLYDFVPGSGFTAFVNMFVFQFSPLLLGDLFWVGHIME